MECRFAFTIDLMHRRSSSQQQLCNPGSRAGFNSEHERIIAVIAAAQNSAVTPIPGRTTSSNPVYDATSPSLSSTIALNRGVSPPDCPMPADLSIE
eukprot:5305198-Prymnesium_polylepis.2